MNVERAREIIRGNSKVKAALLFGHETPLKDSEKTKVRLFTTIKDAETELKGYKESRESLLNDKKVWGSLKLGVFVFESGMNVVLDKKPRKRG